VLAAVLAGCSGDDAAPKPSPTAQAQARGARVVGEHRAGPRLLDLDVRSPALHADAQVRLLLPDGWKQGDGRRWPVLYLLHGCCDTYVSWTRSTRIETLPALRHVLVVMPDGGDVGFYTDWRDGPGWETFHTEELRTLLERDYGAGPERAIAGLSMGGGGAMAYAARHPGMFRAAASFSGLVHPLADAAGLEQLMAGYTSDPDAIWGDPVADRDVWAAHDPTELAAELKGTRLFVSAGNGRPGPFDDAGAGRDAIEPVVEGESRAFAAALRRAGVPVATDFYGPGTHDWPYWERELHRALPVLFR
jgi:S-formylglutathione hydrolase FrmB